MKVTKIYCDCCGKEFTKTDKDTFGDVDINVLNEKEFGRSNRDISRFKSD